MTLVLFKMTNQVFHNYPYYGTVSTLHANLSTTQILYSSHLNVLILNGHLILYPGLQ